MHAKVAKGFQCCSYKWCVLQCDWWMENSPQKVININEAREIGHVEPFHLIVWKLYQVVELMHSFQHVRV